MHIHIHMHTNIQTNIHTHTYIYICSIYTPWHKELLYEPMSLPRVPKSNSWSGHPPCPNRTLWASLGVFFSVSTSHSGKHTKTTTCKSAKKRCSFLAMMSSNGPNSKSKASLSKANALASLETTFTLETANSLVIFWPVIPANS